LIETDRRSHAFLSQSDPYAALAAGLKTAGRYRAWRGR